MDSPAKKPPWLKIRHRKRESYETVLKEVREGRLCTVCAQAACPNQLECYSRGTATFMLLGPACTRDCRFCAVEKTQVKPPDESEPERVARAISKLSLRYCVLTMTSRDDLEDGGAGHMAKTLETIRGVCPGVRAELLISDLGGNRRALDRILGACPDVLNHNVETVPRLYATVRPEADYLRSLWLLSVAAGKNLVVKSGLMVGMGETKREILAVMDDLRRAGCRILTIGQYLAPSNAHHPVARFLFPEEFEMLKMEALSRGFSGVASGPLVRSSYCAGEMFAATVGAGEDNFKSCREKDHE